MKTVYITAFILVSYLCTVNAATTSLVLNLANSVSAGSSATYNCSSEGTGADPTIVWSIRKTDGTTILTNSQLSSSIVDGSSVSTDGRVKSSVIFTVQSSYLTNHRLWCGAIDSGSSTVSMQIYTAISATTTTTASLGGLCSGSVTCSTTFASCVSSVCRCNTGYYDTNGDSNTGGSCSQQASLGGSCQAGNDLSCSTNNAVCNSASQCACNSNGYVASGSTCVSNSAGYGESCINPSRSCPLNAFCSSSTGTCQCNSGYTYSSSLTYCISSTVGYGQSCVNPTRTCPQNANCNTGTCLCNTGYSYSSSTGNCVTNAASLGGSCSNSVACSTTSSSCVFSVCRCNTGYYDTNGDSNAGGSCSLKTGLGQSCSTSVTDSCSDTSASCTGSPATCQCNSGYTDTNGQSNVGGSCTAQTGLGQSCSTFVTDSCSDTSASCTGSPATCQCNSGYYDSNGQSNVGGSCTAQTGLGQSCSTSVTNPCSDTFASCTGSPTTCQCNSGYYDSNGQSNAGGSCSAKTGLGQSCSTSVTDSCSDSSASCTGSPATCQCNSGYYDNNGQSNVGGSCSAKVGLGQSCSTSVTNSCSDTHASCTGSPAACYCDSGYTNTNGACVVSSTSSNCPAGSNVASTVTGATNPSTPSVTVGQTCYEVDLYATRVLECKDSKGTSVLQSARWLKAPTYTTVTTGTGSFINGDITKPNLTVSNAQSSYAGDYVCQLCYGSNYAQCTNGSAITLVVIGTALTSVTVVPSSSTPLRGSQVTFTCSVQPSGAATSYKWYFGSNQVSTSATYSISSIGTSQDGSYRCEASNGINTLTSSAQDVDVQYAPEASGGSTVTITGDLNTADIVITCNMNANPAVLFYTFYNDGGSLLQNSSSNTFTVTSSNGYQIYSCRGRNNVGLSSRQYHDVQEESAPGVGAATENTGLGTGTIAAIVLGIIFLLLLIIIIIVCCCSYGWCRKKERIEPQVIIERPVVKPYIPRTIVSASSTVSRKDVGVMMNGHHDVSVSTDFEEPRYATPRYHLRKDTKGGPIISMYDDGYEQPRAHQLPALDTQYLYPDHEPRKHKKKKRRRRHEDSSPRRQYYEPEPEPEPDVRYATTQPASDEDLVVVPKQNYFE